MGVDLGVTGAYAITDGTEAIAFKWTSLPEIYHELKGILTKRKINLAAMENTHASPQQGKKSVFTFGKNTGNWEGILVSLGIPYIIIPPTKWYKEVLDMRKKTEEKPSVNFVNRRFNMQLAKSRHNEADAICLALYAVKQSDH